MAIDFEKEDAKHPHLRHEVHRRWTIEGHEVALATGHWTDDDGSIRECETSLLCECDFTEEKRIFGGENDPHNCVARKTVRETVLKEARAAYGDAWKKMGLKEAIMDVFRRQAAREYLGSSNAEMLYAQDVAEILNADQKRVMQLCQELQDEERLDLNGWILQPYEPYLRLPHELKVLFAYMIEEPLGWPNGDAGDYFVGRFTGLLEEHAGYTHGRDLVGSENFPHIAPRHLLVTATLWLQAAVSASAREEQEDAKTGSFSGEVGTVRSLSARIRGLIATTGHRDNPSAGKTTSANEAHAACDAADTSTRFTFPYEIKSLLIALHEDTGKGPLDAVHAINRIERILSDTTDYPGGENALWEHNHPHVSPHILWMFGTMWLTSALERAESDEDAKADLRRTRLCAIAEALDDLADRLEQTAL